MTSKRPYLQKTAKELEILFTSAPRDVQILKQILIELEHRSTSSANALRQRVETQLAILFNPKQEVPPHSASEAPKHHIVDCKGCSSKIRIQMTEGSSLYRCPKCKLSFEADYSNKVMKIVFFKEALETPNEEQMTEEHARLVLGVSLSATFSEIKSAWRLLSQQYHPDKHQSLPERLRKAAEVEMGRINQAYELLARVSAQDF